MLADPASQAGERFSKSWKLAVFGVASHLLPCLVISILLSTTRIITCRLQMTVWLHADPDVLVSWGQAKRLDTGKNAGIF
ncbi:hypothetical protein N185_35940 [Sinorhizobium sp. GW3]|nr:hypothetical protein N185_35940 [Sinorhizobium sp. GW3]